MKGQNTWSYQPYQPFLWETGDIYICRIVPYETKIHLEWLGEASVYRVYYRAKGSESFLLAGETKENAFDIENLICETDYEFFTEADTKKSRIRLARCGKSIGTVVNYLHPEDEVYGFSGHYLCSPSLVRHPDGFLLASMDVFAANHPQNLTLIFRSDDDGATWHYVSELMPCFWGKLFIHKNDLYMLSCSTEYGDLLIGKSTDGGKTFSAPVTLLRGANGKNGSSGVHKNPQNIVYHNGRIYETLEWGSWANKEYCHAAMVMSCDENDDLLVPENWSFTDPRPFSQFAPEIADLPDCTMTIEGTLTVAPDGKLYNIMRFGKYATALVYAVNTEDHDAPLTYARCMNFPANYSKFMIKYDEVSKKYYSVATRLYEREKAGARNLLSLMASADLETWDVVTDLYDLRDEDHKKVGLQYVDFFFEGDDILYLCRTAINNANNFHDANYSTFHRIKNFRHL